MGIGSGIVIAAIGAVLSFAIGDRVIEGVDLTMVGYIMIGAGALIAVLSLVTANRKHTAVSTTVATDSAGRQSSTEQRSELPPNHL